MPLNTLQSLGKYGDEQVVMSAIHSFYTTSKHNENTESSFTRVIKLLSEHMADMKMQADSAEMTDAELLLAVYKVIIEKLSGAKSQRHQLILEGVRRFNEMIERAGGGYTAAEVAELLEISPQAVGKKRRRNQLLAVRRGEHAIYPVWQFNGNKVVDGLKELLEELEGLSTVMKTQFLLGIDPEYRMSRIEYLQSNGLDEGLLRKARQLGAQGAG